jgi:hypothetical protein
MKASSLALVFATILSIASLAQAISVVLVTDDAGMHALADSDKRGLIRGTVSSVESKQYGGGPPDVILHFAGVKNDHVFGTIVDTTPWQDLYGRNLSGLVGKTVEIMSKAAEKDSGQIYFGTSFYSDFRVVESGSGSTETASIPAAPSGSASSANSDTSKGHSIDAGTIAKLESLGNDGNMQAQEELGSICFAGYGTIAKDYKKAVFWFQKAVDQNNSMTANMFLARMYENGWGVGRDSILAFGYYENVERSPGNQPLKKAIAPEWTKVQKEKQASSEASNHVDYVDAAGKLHPAGASYPHSHSVEDTGVSYVNGPTLGTIWSGFSDNEKLMTIVAGLYAWGLAVERAHGPYTEQELADIRSRQAETDNDYNREVVRARNSCIWLNGLNTEGCY